MKKKKEIKRKSRWRLLWQVPLWTVLVFLITSLIAVLAYKWLPVPTTPLMVQRSVERYLAGRSPSIDHRWVDITEISHNAPQAVMASEDNLFLKHNGFDFEQIYKARLEALKGGRERGASTISQQTAKNVFLWHGHSWVRKGLEAYFTVLIEKIWGKERIMEVYLNSIEMGDGIFGIEAVAQRNFGVPASDLNARQAALIAATLPNPRKFSSANPSKYMLKRQRQIVDLMGKIENCHMGKKPE